MLPKVYVDSKLQQSKHCLPLQVVVAPVCFCCISFHQAALPKIKENSNAWNVICNHLSCLTTNNVQSYREVCAIFLLLKCKNISLNKQISPVEDKQISMTFSSCYSCQINKMSNDIVRLTPVF